MIVLKESEKLIGQKVYITDRKSMYYNEWGIVKMFDGDHYHVAIANSSDSSVIFRRKEFMTVAQIQARKKK